MERSFTKEVELLRLGDGNTFHGEGILGVTKALLQSGVSYVGGYQGAPISHLMDVLVDASDLLSELGIHLQTCTSEAGAAAMLGASINYPIRGAVTWKSTVGTNVASDALSNLSSAGVTGGALIIVGEDYGEGASIIQERTHAFAMKSQLWLLDPRPNLETITKMVEKGFELSEASNTPVMLELRIRACHVHGSFATRDNLEGEISRNRPLSEPKFDFNRITLPPATYEQEKHKIEVRFPTAVKFVEDNQLNEFFDGDMSDIGIICQGGMYNTAMRCLDLMGLSASAEHTRVPTYVLNVTYPLSETEITRFCSGKRAVLVIEEGQPDYLEQAINSILRKADLQTKVFGKDVLPMAGEYTVETMLNGLGGFFYEVRPNNMDIEEAFKPIRSVTAHKAKAAEILKAPMPARAPSFCTGCPERPVFSAIKILEKTEGPTHISCDIGCHTFSTLPPFNLGHTVLGYGMGLSSAAGLAPNFSKRVISIMGDGGFWHNGLTNGIASAVFNKDDGILVIMKNGYTSATGWQFLPSSDQNRFGDDPSQGLEKALRGVGVNWIKTVHTYHVSKMIGTLRKAMHEKTKGLKVIIADGECQLAKQRRIRPQIAKLLKAGNRVVRTRFGVDAETCTGDHSCIRLSGCPTLTIKDNPDPLRQDPVAYVTNGCVGCGLCGEAAHAAVLCPSFHRIEIVQNPNKFDLWLDRLRNKVIGWFLDRQIAKAAS